jgi:hypothetical protein
LDIRIEAWGKTCSVNQEVQINMPKLAKMTKTKSKNEWKYPLIFFIFKNKIHFIIIINFKKGGFSMNILTILEKK